MITTDPQTTRDTLCAAAHARLRRNRADAEDLAHNVLLRLLKNRTEQWSGGILRKTLGWEITDFHRRERREISIEAVDPAAAPASWAIELLRELLTSEPHANIVIARAHGYTPREIAAATGSTKGAVTVAYHRAMKRLRERAGMLRQRPAPRPEEPLSRQAS